MPGFSLFRRSRPLPPARAFLEDASDTELVALACAGGHGGKAAFVEIVRRHQTAVCAVAWSITGRITLTDDIAQEVFLKAWKRLHTLREPAKLKAWLTRIAHDCAVDALRREPPHLPLTEERAAASFSTETPPDLAAAEAEEEALVWAALALLPENLRTPLVLFYREGQSVAAVAEALDLSPDAVKQRLSRGRNALREQVAAKIETTLGRVQPSAVLVVAVAAAIGALTAPGALAAGAFSTAAAPGGTSFLSTTVTTTMTASPWLAAAALAVFIPIGWNARSVPEPDPPPSPAPEVVEAAALRQRAESSSLMAEWRRLHELHGTDAGAMPALYDDIAKLENEFRRRALRSALLAEWAAMDPAGAFQNLLTVRKNERQTVQLMTEWLKLDPSAAAAHLAANVKGFEIGALELLETVAKAAPEHMAAIALEISATNLYISDRRVQDAFAVYALKDPEAAREAAENFTGARRDQVLAGLAAGWAERDGPAALAWTQALPEGAEREAALKTVLAGWAKFDPVAALNHLDAAPPGEGEDGRYTPGTAAKVLSAAAEKDADATFAWLEKNGGTLGREAWLGLTGVIQKRLNADPAAALDFIAASPKALHSGLSYALGSEIGNESYRHRDAIHAWLQKQEDGEFAQKVRDILYGSAIHQDPAFATMLAAEHPPQDPSSPSLLRQNFSETVPVTDLETFEALLAKYPENQREPLLRDAFARAVDYSEEDIKPWLERLETLSPQTRKRVVSNLAERMAGADPQRAAEWAVTLPDERERQNAAAAVAERWAKADSYEASQWIAGLPPSLERDSAARALAQSIAGVEPDSAWTWAESIIDEGERYTALASIVDAVHKRDPARSRQMVQQSGLNTNERAKLMHRLNNTAVPVK